MDAATASEGSEVVVKAGDLFDAMHVRSSERASA